MYQSSLSTSQMSTATAVAGMGAAVLLFGFVLAGSDLAVATESRPDAKPSTGASTGLRPPIELENPEIKAMLQPGDRIAALEAIAVALTRAGDGATYIWRHGNGRLNGAIRMTGTFRDRDGRICRSLHMMLVSGTFTRKHEGVACRQPDGAWLLIA